MKNKEVKLLVKNKILKRIYEYDDYRKYLKFIFSSLKERFKDFTLKNISEKAGFLSHSFLVLVMNGKRDLGCESMQNLADAVGLNGRYRDYFEKLVKCNQAKTMIEKTNYYDQLQQIKRRHKFYSPDKYQYKYFQKWYYAIVRSLVVHSDWGGDYKKLSNMCFPKITMKQAQKAVEDLLYMGLIVQNDEGLFFNVEKNIDDFHVPYFVKHTARRDVLVNNTKAIDILPPEKRFSVYSVWGMSEKTYKIAIEKFIKFRKEINDLVEEDDSFDGVYNMLFQMFPQSLLENDKKNRGV